MILKRCANSENHRAAHGSEGVEKGSRLFRIYRAAHGSELASE